MFDKKYPFERTTWQIYENYRSKSGSKTQRIGISILSDILSKLGEHEQKGVLFYYFIQKLVNSNSRNSNFLDKQIITIKKSDPNLQHYISKNKNIFPILISHFKAHHILIELKRSTYYVHPSIISALTPEQNNETKAYFKRMQDYDLKCLKQEYNNRIAKEYSDANLPLPPPAAPQPADVCNTSE